MVLAVLAKRKICLRNYVTIVTVLSAQYSVKVTVRDHSTVSVKKESKQAGSMRMV